MNQFWHFFKLAVAVGCGFAAVVCLFVNPALVMNLAVTSIAFSVMPE